MLDINNPFANYGNIVYGDRFVGRQSYLQWIESRVVQPPGGNLSIVSERRVGKSSLAYQAIMARQDELIQQRILARSVSVSTYENPQKFFCDLAGLSFRKLEDLGWANRFIREAAEEVKTRDVERFDFGRLKEFFEHTRAANIRIIFVLDEFDSAARFFTTDNRFFDRLRDLSYRGEATLITVSRDSLSVIERKSHISSTLIGVCEDRTLGMFNDAEIEEHFGRLKEAGISLTAKDRQRIVTCCGGHPYLHDKVAFELVELFRQDGKTHLDEAFRQSERLFLREFASITEHLHSRSLLEPLMQSLFASSAHLKTSELNELVDYGLIRQSGAGYTTFSILFQEHLRQELPIIIEELTPAERRVLFCLHSELQNKEIANQLGVTEHTVKTHIGNIFRKLQVNTRQEAVRRAREREIIE